MHPGVNPLECSDTGIVRTVPRGFGVTHAKVSMMNAEDEQVGLRLAYNGRGSMVHAGADLQLRFDGMNDAQVTAELRRVHLEPVENASQNEYQIQVEYEVSRKEDYVYPVSLYGRNVRDVHSTEHRVYAATSTGLYVMSFMNSEGLWSPQCESVRDAQLVTGCDQRDRGHVVYVYGSNRLERIAVQEDGTVTTVNLYDDAHRMIRDADWHTMIATDRGFWIASTNMVARYHEDTESWEPLARPDSDLLIHGLSIIGHGYAYACGSAGAVWYYDNRQWKRTDGTMGDAAVVKISATNRFNVVAIQHPNVVWFSQNGGHTWNQRALPGDTESTVLTVVDISKDDMTVMVGGYHEGQHNHQPALYTIVSDEKEWRSQSIPHAQGALAHHDQTIQSIHLFDSELAWVACTHGLYVSNRTQDEKVAFRRTLKYATAQDEDASSAETREASEKVSDHEAVEGENKVDEGEPVSPGLTSGAWAGIGVAIALLVFLLVWAAYVALIR